jgi:hypothetical protein
VSLFADQTPEVPPRPVTLANWECWSGMGPALARQRQALRVLGKKPRYLSTPEVRAIVRHVLGPDATYREVTKKSDPHRAYGIVEAPGFHRLVNEFGQRDGTCTEARRRMVARLLDPKTVNEARK